MTLPPPTALVPFSRANPETRQAFLRGLRDLRGLEGNPSAWHCTKCDARTSGDKILISYNVGDTPIPFCPAKGCFAYGPDLEATKA